MSADEGEGLDAAFEELGLRLLEQKQTIYRLQREVDRLRPLALAAPNAAEYRRGVARTLAAITWCEDLEEARELAARAIAGDHEGLLPDDDSASISHRTGERE